MRYLFTVGLLLALAGALVSTPAMALHIIHGQVILDNLDDYTRCQGYDDTGDMCHDALKRWVEGHPADVFQAGKMTRKIMNSWVAVPFFVQAFDQKIGDCKDQDVKLSVVSALELPPDRDDNVIPQAKKIGFQICYNDLKDAIIESIGDSSSYTLMNVCPDLIAKGALSGLRLARCQAVK